MARTSSPKIRLEWENRVQRQQTSGLSISHWCCEHKIAPSAFYYWKDKISPKTSLDQSCFTELADSKNRDIVLEYQDIRICLTKDFDPVALKQCLTLLQELKC